MVQALPHVSGGDPKRDDAALVVRKPEGKCVGARRQPAVVEELRGDCKGPDCAEHVPPVLQKRHRPKDDDVERDQYLYDRMASVCPSLGKRSDPNSDGERRKNEKQEWSRNHPHTCVEVWRHEGNGDRHQDDRANCSDHDECRRIGRIAFCNV